MLLVNKHINKLIIVTVVAKTYNYNSNSSMVQTVYFPKSRTQADNMEIVKMVRAGTGLNWSK